VRVKTSRLALLSTFFVVLSSHGARADEDSLAPDERPESESRTYINARVGASSVNENGKPEVCVEAAPISFLSVEACGTGAQVWHDDAAPEMAHFRLKGRFLSLPFSRFWLQSFAGLGFAELSVGNDDPGFAFRGPSEALTSTAGGELSLSTRALVPLGRGFDLLSDLTLGAAYLPHANDLILARSRFQPSVSFSLGVGF
jgi:hypothetical protein